MIDTDWSFFSENTSASSDPGLAMQEIASKCNFAIFIKLPKKSYALKNQVAKILVEAHRARHLSSRSSMTDQTTSMPLHLRQTG